jgi:hypothetical protein
LPSGTWPRRSSGCGVVVPAYRVLVLWSTERTSTSLGFDRVGALIDIMMSEGASCDVTLSGY